LEPATCQEEIVDRLIMNQNRILVTGAAGFIGASLMSTFKNFGIECLGVDNFSNYYEIGMKHERIKSLKIDSLVTECDITKKDDLVKIVHQFRPTVIINLAAQGGVRASKKDPSPYILSNQQGFLNVLEIAENFEVDKFIYASSSSVYGENSEAPFSEIAKLEMPKSLYALSKMSNEIISRYFPEGKTKRIGLRFFTVYGPWGRPDMAMFQLLASAKLKEVFNFTANPEVKRDFTFIDDVTLLIRELVELESSLINFDILNVCGSHPYSMGELFQILKNEKIYINILQQTQDPLDLKLTNGSINRIVELKLPIPATSLITGVRNTQEWIAITPEKLLRSWYEFSNKK